MGLFIITSSFNITAPCEENSMNKCKLPVLKITFLYFILIVTVTSLIGCRTTYYSNLNKNSSNGIALNSGDIDIESTYITDSDSTKVSDTDTDSAPSPSAMLKGTFGNTAGNLHNDAIAAIEDNVIYFSTSTGLYKTDGDRNKRIYSNPVRDINVQNGWIYCIDGLSLIKLKSDGTSVQTLVTDVDDVVLANGHLYYVHRNGYLYKTSTDGSNSEMIIAQKIKNLCITEDTIYWGNGINLCVADTNGKNNWLYKSLGSQNIIIHNGYKYSAGKLRRQTLDFKETKVLIESGVTCITASGDWIYFINSEDDMSLYKIRTDGSDLIKLNDTYSDKPSVVGDWIYYTTYTTTNNDQQIYKYCRIRTDGSDNQVLE